MDCLTCICYIDNWEQEVEDKMKNASGEECSQGFLPFVAGDCPCYQNIEDN